MKTALAAAVCSLAAFAFVGCASKHEEGVKSSYRSQYTNVAADVKTTSDAAKSVLEDEQLMNVTGSSTNVDGKAMGKKADGTEVKVWVEKDGTATSKVQVTVGMTGDPALGAEIAKKVKMKAEGNKMDAARSPM